MNLKPASKSSSFPKSVGSADLSIWKLYCHAGMRVTAHIEHDCAKAVSRCVQGDVADIVGFARALLSE